MTQHHLVVFRYHDVNNTFLVLVPRSVYALLISNHWRSVYVFYGVCCKVCAKVAKFNLLLCFRWAPNCICIATHLTRFGQILPACQFVACRHAVATAIATAVRRIILYFTTLICSLYCTRCIQADDPAHLCPPFLPFRSPRVT